MTEQGIAFRINLASAEEARAIAGDVTAQGGQATVSEDDKGALPLAVLLAIVIPPGVALLAIVINRIVQTWRGRGIVVDARGTGAPIILKDDNLPFGTVVLLTRDGDKVTRSDLAEQDIGKYLGQAVAALSGGKSASEAKKIAEKVLGD